MNPAVAGARWISARWVLAASCPYIMTHSALVQRFSQPNNHTKRLHVEGLNWVCAGFVLGLSKQITAGRAYVFGTIAT